MEVRLAGKGLLDIRKAFSLSQPAPQCWISAEQGEPDHPHFGDVAEIYNVIDARQSEAQNTVIEALRGLGYDEQADHYTHFSYEMVALTPRCAAELGYELSEDERARSYIEVSGRRGFGVKADDLIDKLIASAQKEVDSRHAELDNSERQKISKQIAIGALRYFMLKFTKQSVIAFDFKDALSFEGETGPYAQYAVVRATNIFRKGGIDPDAFAEELGRNFSSDELGKFLVGKDDKDKDKAVDANELWELWLAASKTAYLVDQCIATTEPAYLAKHVFQLAQLFNTFYHRHPILAEVDQQRKKFLLATAAVVRRELIRALGVMGIEVSAGDVKLAAALASRDHQACAYHKQCDTHGRRQKIIVVRVHAQVDVAGVNAMTFGMRDRNEEGQNPE